MLEGERQVGLLKEVIKPEMIIEAIMNGEREAHKTLAGISIDHQCRYRWVASKLDSSDTVLDAICGVGYGSYILSLANPYSVSSFDICQEAIDYANKYYARPNITYSSSDYLDMEYAEASFSKIIHFEAIEHIAQPEVMLEKFHRWLKDDGTLYISCPNELTNPFSKERYPFHMRHYTPQALYDLLDGAGFKLESWYSQTDERATKLDNGTAGVTMIGVCGK